MGHAARLLRCPGLKAEGRHLFDHGDRHAKSRRFPDCVQLQGRHLDGALRSAARKQDSATAAPKRKWGAPAPPPEVSATAPTIATVKAAAAPTCAQEPSTIPLDTEEVTGPKRLGLGILRRLKVAKQT